ncbi:hypothetical protein AQPW35_42690 [Rubrivivax pictus]|uniref:Inhibitor I9 domain-containing protein n=1 Tax=Pseudaquabacterium pictum TaxID=2315236 RepID=A0A480B2E2_9BURK|nr:hypothetical protein AQPW35_42690 [Rubrivivax pictus]
MSAGRRLSLGGLGLCVGLCCAGLPCRAGPVAAGTAAATGAPQASDRVAVWVDLSLPVPRAAASSDVLAMRQAVEAQQHAVAAQLGALGATELARVLLVRNAIAVELPRHALPLVRQLPGVLRVRPVTHRHQVDVPAADPLRP